MTDNKPCQQKERQFKDEKADIKVKLDTSECQLGSEKIQETAQQSGGHKEQKSDYTQQTWKSRGNQTPRKQCSRKKRSHNETGDSPEEKIRKCPKLLFCNYCGDDTLSLEDLSTDRICHKECLRYCIRKEEAINIFKNCFAKSNNVLSMAINVTYLYGLKGIKDENKKVKRSYKLDELSRIVSALRNSNSGYVLIHLVGLAQGDSYIAPFSEFADPKLHDLIIDGSSFDDVYEKRLLSDYRVTEELDELNDKILEFSDFLVLYVEGSEYLVTADLKTKTALDDRIIDQSDLSVFRLLAKRKDFKEEFPPCSPNILSLRESISVQLKSYHPGSDLNRSLVNYMLEHKLVDNISAFTKNRSGGSYYLGVSEDQSSTDTSYVSKDVSFTPVTVTDEEQLNTDIQQRLGDILLVCDYDGKVLKDARIVKLELIPVPQGAKYKWKQQGETENDFVVCVPVRPVRGIVFCDREGPLAYRVGKDGFSITKLRLKEWFRAFMSQPNNI